MEQRIKGTTGLMALIGSPVGHSGSPAMYNFSFRHHNLDYAYMAFDIKEDQVPAALDAIRLFKMRVEASGRGGLCAPPLGPVRGRRPSGRGRGRGFARALVRIAQEVRGRLRPCRFDNRHL